MLDAALRTLLHELYAALGTGTTLTLTPTMLSGFTPFAGLGGLPITSLILSDVRIELTHGELVDTSAPSGDGARASGRPVKRFAAAGEASVRIRTLTTFLGLTSAVATIEFVVRGNGSRATLVTVQGSGAAGLTSALTGALPATVASLLQPVEAVSGSRPTIQNLPAKAFPGAGVTRPDLLGMVKDVSKEVARGQRVQLLLLIAGRLAPAVKTLPEPHRTFLNTLLEDLTSAPAT